MTEPSGFLRRPECPASCTLVGVLQPTRSRHTRPRTDDGPSRKRHVNGTDVFDRNGVRLHETILGTFRRRAGAHWHLDPLVTGYECSSGPCYPLFVACVLRHLTAGYVSAHRVFHSKPKNASRKGRVLRMSPPILEHGRSRYLPEVPVTVAGLLDAPFETQLE